MMKKLKIRHFNFAPVIGFGYWKDLYTLPSSYGYCHNIILPFIRLQMGELYFPVVVLTNESPRVPVKMVEITVTFPGMADDGKPAVTVKGNDLPPGKHLCIETYQGLYKSGWHLTTDIAIAKFKSGHPSAGILDLRPCYRLPFDFEITKP